MTPMVRILQAIELPVLLLNRNATVGAQRTGCKGRSLSACRIAPRIKLINCDSDPGSIMNKSILSLAIVIASVLLPCGTVLANGPVEVLPGVWRFTFAETEKITPVKTRHYPPALEGLAMLPRVVDCPLTVTAGVSERGVLVHAPLANGEMIYGLGLQFQSFQQRGLKKKLRVNADPAMDTGDSHAPVPFYVTTRGYGVLIDTARYATFYLGDTKLKPRGTER